MIRFALEIVRGRRMSRVACIRAIYANRQASLALDPDNSLDSPSDISPHESPRTFPLWPPPVKWKINLLLISIGYRIRVRHKRSHDLKCAGTGREAKGCEGVTGWSLGVRFPIPSLERAYRRIFFYFCRPTVYGNGAFLYTFAQFLTQKDLFFSQHKPQKEDRGVLIRNKIVVTFCF